MSLFSSLSYLLKRAASDIKPTTSIKPPLNSKMPKLNDEIFIADKSESSTIHRTSFDSYLNLLMKIDNFTNTAETNDTFEKWTDFITLPQFTTNPFGNNDTYVSESDVQFSNETYHNADHLLENWWNIFDTRYLRHGWGWTTTLIIAYMLILVIGVIGNLMVILVVLLRPQMRSVTNMFIMNLAVADLLVIVFCVPSTLLANIFAPWILGSFMCKAVAHVQGVSVCASAYSLAAISLDRCQAIYRNHERPRGFSQSICVGTVFVIWTFATALTIPWAVVFEVKVSEYDGLRYCVETWEVKELGDIYFLVVNLGGFYSIPLLLIFVSNWIIYCHVTHRSVPHNSASSAPIKKMHRQTRHVVLRMLGIVTLTFLFSWLPLYILVIIIKFSENISESEYNVLGIVMPIAQWLGSWNSSINPILYAFLNKKFRKMFKSILPSWIPVNQAGKYVGSTRLPSFTTNAYTGKSFVRSRTNSRSDCLRHHQTGCTNSPRQAFLLATTTVKVLSSTMPATAVLIGDSLKNILDTSISDKIQTGLVTDL